MTPADRRAVEAWLGDHQPQQGPPPLPPDQQALYRYWDALCDYWTNLWFLVNRNNVRRDVRQMYGPRRR